MFLRLAIPQGVSFNVETESQQQLTERIASAILHHNPKVLSPGSHRLMFAVTAGGQCLRSFGVLVAPGGETARVFKKSTWIAFNDAPTVAGLFLPKMPRYQNPVVVEETFLSATAQRSEAI